MRTKAEKMPVDTLWAMWNSKQIPDSIRLNALNDIAWQVLFSDPDSAYKLAEMQIKEAIRLDIPQWHSGGINIQGISQAIRGNNEESIKIFQQCLELKLLEKDPQNYDARLNLAIIYGRNGFYDEAIGEFEKILADKPDDSAVLNNMGNLFFMQEKYSEALEMYERAEQANGRDAGVLMNLALVHYKIGKLDEARARFKEGEEISKEVARDFSLLRSLLFD